MVDGRAVAVKVVQQKELAQQETRALILTAKDIDSTKFDQIVVDDGAAEK
jgi:hypothetical protein